ncbi:MAG: nucleotidyltransferase domain-containing protein [bacterium]
MIENNSIQSIRVFGSYGRGDADSFSDLDILIVTNKNNDISEIANDFDDEILNRFHKKPSYAWYSKARIEAMYASGHLFAWHLYQESKPVYKITNDLIKILGKPNKYEDAISDAQSIYKIMNSIKPSIIISPINSVYESGVLFVCLRNLGLILSSVLKDNFDFTLDSPYHLNENSLCLDYSEYNILKQNRRASMRGLPSQQLDIVKLINIIEVAIKWTSEKLIFLKEELCSGDIIDSKVG